jgi:hypothetical protein
MRLGLALDVTGQGLPAFYSGASVALDFVNGNYRAGASQTGTFANLSGVSVTRASVGYAQDASGNLVSFASGVPRLTNQGLLVEESRTNLLKWSQDFTHAGGFTANLATPTASGLTVPDGTTTGQTLTASAGAGNHEVFQLVTITSASNYAISIYAKPGTTRYVFITLGGTAANYAFAVFDLQGGGSVATQTGVGGTSGTIASTSQQAVAGGWMRVTMVGQITATSGFVAYGIAAAATANTVNTTGEVTFTAAGTENVGIWQADQQLGSFPLSPILTTSATATRAQDVVTLQGLTVPNTALTLIARGVPMAAGSAAPQDIAEFNDGATTNNLLRLIRAATTGNSQAVVFAGGANTFVGTGAAWAANTASTIAVSAANGTQLGSFAGSSTNSASSATQPSGMTQLNIGSNISSVAWNGYLTLLLLYPTAFGQAQLNAATA